MSNTPGASMPLVGPLLAARLDSGRQQAECRCDCPPCVSARAMPVRTVHKTTGCPGMTSNAPGHVQLLLPLLALPLPLGRRLLQQPRCRVKGPQRVRVAVVQQVLPHQLVRGAGRHGNAAREQVYGPAKVAIGGRVDSGTFGCGVWV